MAKPKRYAYRPKIFNVVKYAAKRARSVRPSYKVGKKPQGYLSRPRAKTSYRGGSRRPKEHFTRTPHRGTRYNSRAKNVRTKDLGVAKYSVTSNFASAGSAKNLGGYALLAGTGNPADFLAIYNDYNDSMDIGGAIAATTKFQIVRDYFKITIVGGPKNLVQPINITTTSPGYLATPLSNIPVGVNPSPGPTVGAQLNRTYFRVYLWKCRKDMPLNAVDYTSWLATYQNLYQRQVGANSGDLLLVDFSPFENTPWCEMMECIKSWKFTLGPVKNVKVLTYASKPYRLNYETDNYLDFLGFKNRSTVFSFHYQGGLGLSDGKGSGGASTLGLPERDASGAWGVELREEYGYNAVFASTDLNTELDLRVGLRAGDTSLVTVPANNYGPIN